MLHLIFLVSALALAFSAPLGDLPVLGIVGGRRANQLRFNYQISLEILGQHYCGGTLISTNIVITAAHCVGDIHPYYFQVRVGSADRETGGEVFPVQDIERHPDFKSDTLHSDIAVIKLHSNVKLSKAVGTLPLISEEPLANTQALISGWGHTKEDGELSDELLYAKIEVFDREYCESRIKPFTKEMICAGHKDGSVDSCQADSGGPLVANNHLIGVISWGDGCANYDSPGIYTNIAYMRPWIDATILKLSSIAERD